MKKRLSAVIITFNEEKNIERCIQSILEVADEIIVVDSFSNDNTEALCSKYQVRFIKHPFEGHIQQKNIAKDLASFDYVLSLDADEALSERLKNNILNEKIKGFPKQGYYFNRVTNYCGTWIKHGGWYPDKKLRLWKKNLGHWTGINPHDKLEMVDGNINTGFLHGDILHYSYYSIDEHYKQAYYFADIAANELYIKGKKTSSLGILIHSLAKFIKMYLVQKGFLDGKYGFIIAKISTQATYYKYLKLKNLMNANKSHV